MPEGAIPGAEGDFCVFLSLNDGTFTRFFHDNITVRLKQKEEKMERVIFAGKPDQNGNYGAEINKALQECAGKKVLVIEKGVYPTGPIDIPSHTRLVLEEGAELSFIPDFSIYPPVG